MYETYYGLKEKPFSMTADPAFLYLSRFHEEALAHLLYGIRQRLGFLMITGEVGTGKTTLVKALIEKLETPAACALVLHPTLSGKELLVHILRDFGMQPNGEKHGELLRTMEQFLLKTAQEGAVAVLIVDEAQDLSAGTLEQIRLLSNIETPKKKLLQIVLVGQPELSQRLARNHRLRALRERIAVSYHIRPISEEEVPLYIEHRLRIAGAISAGAFFTRGAVGKIAEISEGIPRRIHLLCDRALLTGFVREAPVIDESMIEEGGMP